MFQIRFILVAMAILATQPVYAAAAPGNKPCDTIADACSAAGFVREESPDKGIWRDCMKPVILGRTVSGVTIDSSVAKSCRKQKIQELKMELKELESSR